MNESNQLSTVNGLLGHLADTMLKLSNKTIDIEEAKAQASLVKQSNNLLRFELDSRKFEYVQKRNLEAPELK